MLFRSFLRWPCFFVDDDASVESALLSVHPSTASVDWSIAFDGLYSIPVTPSFDRNCLPFLFDDNGA